MSTILRQLAAWICVFALAGCSMFGSSVPKLRIGDVRVVAAADANRNSPPSNCA